VARHFYVIVLAVFWCCLRASAQEESTSFDVIVRIADADDRLLLERVRGQTNDLDILLFTDSLSNELEPTLPEQLATARKLSEAQGVRVVVWFTHERGTLTVLVAEPAAGRILVRALEPQEGPLGTSAQHEAAALVVRSAIRALAAGGEIGVTETEVAPVAPPPVVATPARPAPTSAPVHEKKPMPIGWELVQHLGARSALDGVGPSGQHALSARFVLRRRAFQLELRGALGWPARIDDRLARVSLQRHEALVYVGYVPFASERWLLSVAAGAGLNVFLTDVDARTSALRASEGSAFLGALGLDATLRFMPRWAKGHAGFAAVLGAEALPATPVIGYFDVDGTFVARDQVWSVLPTAALELVVRFK
jgi:hypothetical protein